MAVDRSKIHPDLVKLVEAVESKTQCKLICGHRGEKEQNEAYKRGNSKLIYPYSKHNELPSQAIDLVPLPIDWNNIEAFKQLALLVKQEASRLQLNIISGGLDWKWKDWPHYELGRNNVEAKEREA